MRRAPEAAQERRHQAKQELIQASFGGSRSDQHEASEEYEEAKRAEKQAATALGECARQKKLVTIGDTEINIYGRVKPHQEKEVLRVLKGIPESQLVGLSEITLHGKPSDRDLPVKDERTGETVRVEPGATYSPRDKSIVDWYPPEAREIKHEIGHHVYYERLSDAQRAEWETFWGTNTDKMPTDYARKNNAEGFAEAYEFFYDRPDDLNEDVKEKIHRLLEAIS